MHPRRTSRMMVKAVEAIERVVTVNVVGREIEGSVRIVGDVIVVIAVVTEDVIVVEKEEIGAEIVTEAEIEIEMVIEAEIGMANGRGNARPFILDYWRGNREGAALREGSR